MTTRLVSSGIRSWTLRRWNSRRAWPSRFLGMRASAVRPLLMPVEVRERSRP
jgi:hypothetical protein